MIYLGNNPVGVGVGQYNLKLLRTLTFENTNERQAIVPSADWANYDFLLLVPDMTVTSQDGQTSGNWLWFQITNTNGSGSLYTSSNYSANGTTGIRNMYDALMVYHAWVGDRYYWRAMFMTGRGANVQSVTGHQDEESLATVSLLYGGYYQGTYAYLNGTVKIYGGKFME